jgi:hypothetical protein
LARVFGGCVTEDSTVRGLEAGYLRANPIEVDEEEPIAVGAVPVPVSIPDPVEAVYLPGLVATLPHGFASNTALQKKVQGHIMAWREAIDKAF